MKLSSYSATMLRDTASFPSRLYKYTKDLIDENVSTSLQNVDILDEEAVENLDAEDKGTLECIKAEALENLQKDYYPDELRGTTQTNKDCVFINHELALLRGRRFIVIEPIHRPNTFNSAYVESDEVATSKEQTTANPRRASARNAGSKRRREETDDNDDRDDSDDVFDAPSSGKSNKKKTRRTNVGRKVQNTKKAKKTKSVKGRKKPLLGCQKGRGVTHTRNANRPTDPDEPTLVPPCTVMVVLGDQHRVRGPSSANHMSTGQGKPSNLSGLLRLIRVFESIRVVSGFYDY